ncbi:MAG: hypothetical protein ABSC18_16590 [Verrucomicrobiota bacterium]|jgi:hypothetical protein
MKEMDSLEQEMGEWRPRKSSKRLGRWLFGRAERAPVALRRAEFWHWLTPVAACALTVLVAVGSGNHRGEALEGKGGPILMGGFHFDPGSSNAPQMVSWSQADQNVQWNVCPELTLAAGDQSGASPAPVGAGREAATNLNRN